MAYEMWYQLPPDMNTWNTAVIENLSRKVPEAPNYVSGIEWSKLDPSTGDGDALISLMNGLGAAPVTVRGNKLAPIDIIVTKVGNDPKFYPLSPLFLRKIYADNVIGEPVANTTDRDESYEGPSRRVQNIKTVDAVKYASVDSAQHLLEKISSSDIVTNWMMENMPETVVAIYDRANQEELEKEAATSAPELLVITKDGNKYYVNGEESDSSDVGELAKLAGVSDYQLGRLVGNSEPLIYDAREKLADIHIPTEQDVTMFEIDNPIEFEARKEHADSTPYSLTTVYLRDKRKVRGILVSNSVISSNLGTNLPGVPDQRDKAVDCFNNYIPSKYGPELFISTEGYGIQQAIKSDVRTPISLDMIKSCSETNVPAMGMVGIFLPKSEYSQAVFGRIESYVSLGKHYKAHIYNLVSHEAQCVTMDEYDFYAVPDTQLAVLREEEKFDNVSVSGVVGRVVRDNDGNYVIDGEKTSVVNCPYALMSKYASSYSDAMKILKIASEIGSCVFEKVSAENDNPDKTKTDKKGTKSGTDDSRDASQQQQNPSNSSLAQQTPESALSTTDPSSQVQQQYGAQQYGVQLQDGQMSQDNFFGDAQQQQQNMMYSPMSQPVNSKDMENMVQINSPAGMDALMMGSLASDNMTSKDTLARTSDALVTALSHLSQLLFLIRQGAINYIAENDVQAAMNKVNDVSQSLGIDPVQVGTM